MIDDNSSDLFFLEGVIESFEQKNAIIVLADGQRLVWPIINLPANCDLGGKVRLVLTTSVSDGQQREKMAKSILNEILKKSDDATEK